MPTGLPCGAMPTGPTGLTGPAVGMPLTTPAPVAPAPTVQMPNDGSLEVFSKLLVPSSNKCIASSNKCLTSSNKKLVETIS